MQHKKGKQHTHAHLHPNRKATTPEEDSPALWAKHIGKSVLVTAVVGLLFTLLGSLIAYFTPDPNRFTMALGLAASAFTALVGGFTALRIHGHSALLCGLLNGSVFIALMMLISLFFTEHSSSYSGTVSFLLHAAFLLLSVAGAYLGLSKPKKFKARR